jgi:hypothetical protein
MAQSHTGGNWHETGKCFGWQGIDSLPHGRACIHYPAGSRKFPDFMVRNPLTMKA